jgi:hypothetical protein
VSIEVGVEAPIELIARLRTNGRSIAQWSSLEPGRSDDLTAGP